MKELGLNVMKNILVIKILKATELLGKTVAAIMGHLY